MVVGVNTILISGLSSRLNTTALSFVFKQKATLKNNCLRLRDFDTVYHLYPCKKWIYKCQYTGLLKVLV